MSRAVERHYDSLDVLYRWFWGEHVHHGLWSGGDGSARGAPERLVARLAARAAIGAGDRVLDVGCGYGASGRWLAREHGCRVVGITLSARQARFAYDRSARAPGGGAVRILRADAADLPFSQESFDALWVIECIEHLEDKPEFFRTARRHLRPGGRLALCSWQRGESNGPAADRLVRRVCDAFVCPDLAAASDYRRWCEAAGLRVRIEEDLTSGVAPTWDVVRRRTGRVWARPLRWLIGGSNRRFVDGFDDITEAFATGAMSYGLWVAVRDY